MYLGSDHSLSLTLLNGNQAAAYAARLSRIDVFSGYPITPEAPLMHYLTAMMEQGEPRARFLRMESDHSAMAGAIGAALAGARAFSGTNSQGLAYMSELLFHASGLRLPIVLAVVNRAMSAPHSRFPEWSDALAQETTGWLQLYCENNQEVLDTIIQAYRVAEDERVHLPVMVNYEGYILSHTQEPVDLPDQAEVDAFLPKELKPILDVGYPVAVNTVTSPNIYTEYKFNQHRAMQAAAPVIEEVGRGFAAAFGRRWGGLAEAYRLEGAELALVTMGSLTS
ncbi:MAG: pyruvate synthase, partial [Firmicutes bacterium]|nr:pyruvate synthase [Bacillota bacterium]